MLTIPSATMVRARRVVRGRVRRSEDEVAPGTREGDIGTSGVVMLLTLTPWWWAAWTFEGEISISVVLDTFDGLGW